MTEWMLRVEQLTKRFGGLLAVDCISFDVGEGGIIRPHQLPQVHQQAAEYTGEGAHQHGRQQHVATGIMNVLGQRRDTVETEIRERGERAERSGVSVLSLLSG